MGVFTEKKSVKTTIYGPTSALCKDSAKLTAIRGHPFLAPENHRYWPVRLRTVLDGDDGLVRKSLEQIDLSVGELTDFGASDSNHADCLIHAHQKDGQGTARELNSLGLGLRTGDLDRSPIEHGTSGDDLSR